MGNFSRIHKPYPYSEHIGEDGFLPSMFGDIFQEKKTLIEAGDEEGAKALEEKGIESIISMEEIDMENLDVSGQWWESMDVDGEIKVV